MNQQAEPFLSTLDPQADAAQVHVSRAHESAHLHVSGRATYTDDIPLVAGTLHAALGLSANVEAVRVNANLHGKPAIIVQGRSDALVPVNHASRAYVAQNSLTEGSRSGLVFYEVTNGQHFDAFLPVAGYDTRFVPVHYYDLQALNLMWQHLKKGAPLPPSQVIRTVPRGGTPGAAPALTTANLPPIASAPGANAISAAAGTIDVPL